MYAVLEAENAISGQGPSNGGSGKISVYAGCYSISYIAVALYSLSVEAAV